MTPAKNESLAAIGEVHCGNSADLLILLAGFPVSADGLDRTRKLLRKGVDWPVLFRMAQRHAVLPLVTANLISRFSADIPDAVGGEVRRVLAAAALRSDHHLEQLREVASLLSAKGILVATMKGPVFAAATYGSPALRQSEDIDILVNAKDLKSVWAALRSLGFEPRFDLSERQQEALRNFCDSWPFLCERRKMLIDLHWRFDCRLCPVRADDALAQSVVVQVDGHPYSTFSSEDQLLYLCFHGLKHFWNTLGTVADIGGVLRNDLDWQYLLHQSRDPTHRRVLLLGLLMARQVFNASLPAEIKVHADAQPDLKKMVQVACSLLYAGDRASAFNFRHNQTRAELGVIRQPLQRAAFLMDRLLRPNERDCRMLTLPRALFSLYYPLRLLRLPWMYTGILAKRSRCWLQSER